MPKTVYDQQVIGTGLMANYADWLGRGVWNGGGVCGVGGGCYGGRT